MIATATSTSVVPAATSAGEAHASSDEQSSATKAGIGVGVTIFVLVALFAGIWLIVRRPKRGRNGFQHQRMAAGPYMHQRQFAQLIAEQPPTELSAERSPAELNAEQRFELEARRLP